MNEHASPTIDLSARPPQPGASVRPCAPQCKRENLATTKVLRNPQPAAFTSLCAALSRPGNTPAIVLRAKRSRAIFQAGAASQQLPTNFIWREIGVPAQQTKGSVKAKTFAGRQQVTKIITLVAAVALAIAMSGASLAARLAYASSSPKTDGVSTCLHELEHTAVKGIRSVACEPRQGAHHQ
jgi:hypothetical protein